MRTEEENRQGGKIRTRTLENRKNAAPARQIGSPGELLLDQAIQKCCVDRLSWHDFSGFELAPNHEGDTTTLEKT